MTRNHADRFILQRTAEGMHSAVRHIGNVVDWLSGDGERTYGGISVKGEVEELRRMKPVIIEALEQCCAWIRDEWPHIENNKARLHELALFLREYDAFRSAVMEYDDARIDNPAKDEHLFDQYLQPQEYVIVVARFDKELEFAQGHSQDVIQGYRSKAPLEGLSEKLCHKFCTGLSDEALDDLIRYHEPPMLKGTWFGDKNMATYFGKVCGLPCELMNQSFIFYKDDGSGRAIKLNYSRNDADKVDSTSELGRILKVFPIDSIRKRQ